MKKSKVNSAHKVETARASAFRFQGCRALGGLYGFRGRKAQVFQFGVLRVVGLGV